MVKSNKKVSSPTPFGLRRETTINAFGGEPFTEEEIEEMYLRYQSQIPKTLEEKRGWLISHYSKYALSAILSELKDEQQKSQKEASKEAADERLPLNSIEAVLGEVARQRAVFEVNWCQIKTTFEP
jgi:hypothetical protein